MTVPCTLASTVLLWIFVLRYWRKEVLAVLKSYHKEAQVKGAASIQLVDAKRSSLVSITIFGLYCTIKWQNSGNCQLVLKTLALSFLSDKLTSCYMKMYFLQIDCEVILLHNRFIDKMQC